MRTCVLCLGYCSPSFLSIFEDPRVEFIQADLTKEAHRERAFSNERFDYVVNLAAESKYGQPESVYDVRCTQLSVACAQKARAENVRRFIEVSTALVYRPQARRPAIESSALHPWTRQSIAKLAAEEGLRGIEGLNTVVLRPTFIYGPGDMFGLMPRITCAAAYVELQETMQFLWDAQMRINTVHVRDVCKAIWHCIRTVPAGTVWNLSDKNDTDQGKLNSILSRIFGIRTGFVGTMLSNVARLRLRGGNSRLRNILIIP
jgi:nucleoside-diphosphate-sugar epimerase